MMPLIAHPLTRSHGPAYSRQSGSPTTIPRGVYIKPPI